MKAGESAFRQLVFQYKRSAKNRGFAFELSNDDFRELVTSDCYYCGDPPGQKVHTAKGTNGGMIYTGIDRVDNKEGYTVKNSRPCCKTCNFAKGRMSNEEFTGWIRKLIGRFSQQCIFCTNAARFEFGKQG